MLEMCSAVTKMMMENSVQDRKLYNALMLDQYFSNRERKVLRSDAATKRKEEILSIFAESLKIAEVPNATDVVSKSPFSFE